jgi:hypothetical protein
VSYYLLKGRRGSLCSGTPSPVEPTHYIYIYIYAFLPKTHTPLVRLPNLLIIELSVKSPSVLPPYLLSFHPLISPSCRKKETQDETQFTIKVGGKTSLGPSYFLFVKFSFPVNMFDALLC